MSTLNLNDLGEHLPLDSVTWQGFGLPVMVNLNLVAGDDLTIESPCIEPIAKLLEGLYALQLSINTQRALASQPPIALVDRKVETSANGNPLFFYSLSIEINPQDALNSILNPLD